MLISTVHVIEPHILDWTTRLDAITESHPVLVIRVFTRAQDVLGACVVGMLIQHPATTLHLNGITATEIRAQVRTVSAALMTTALKVLVFKECNLDAKKITKIIQHCTTLPNYCF